MLVDFGLIVYLSALNILVRFFLTYGQHFSFYRQHIQSLHRSHRLKFLASALGVTRSLKYASSCVPPKLFPADTRDSLRPTQKPQKHTMAQEKNQHKRQGNSFYGGRPRHTQNRHKAKLDEIKKSLTHRSNLKRNYFKMLKKEGLSIPELETKFSDDKPGKKGKPEKKDKKEQKEKAEEESGDEEEGSDEEEEQGGFFEGEASESEAEDLGEGSDDAEDDEEEENEEEDKKEDKSAKRRKPLPDQQPPTKEQLREMHESQKPRKPMNFKERAALAKERKQKAREEREAQIQKNKEDRERKLKKRAKLTKQMTKTTRTGQPLMTPRINKILDQLKQ